MTLLLSMGLERTLDIHLHLYYDTQMNKLYIETRAKALLKVHSLPFAQECLSLAAGVPVVMDHEGNVTILPRPSRKVKKDKYEKRERREPREEYEPEAV
jgi:hypothetical protein